MRKQRLSFIAGKKLEGIPLRLSDFRLEALFGETLDGSFFTGAKVSAQEEDLIILKLDEFPELSSDRNDIVGIDRDTSVLIYRGGECKPFLEVFSGKGEERRTFVLEEAILDISAGEQLGNLIAEKGLGFVYTIKPELQLKCIVNSANAMDIAYEESVPFHNAKVPYRMYERLLGIEPKVAVGDGSQVSALVVYYSIVNSPLSSRDKEARLEELYEFVGSRPADSIDPLKAGRNGTPMEADHLGFDPKRTYDLGDIRRIKGISPNHAEEIIGRRTSLNGNGKTIGGCEIAEYFLSRSMLFVLKGLGYNWRNVDNLREAVNNQVKEYRLSDH